MPRRSMVHPRPPYNRWKRWSGNGVFARMMEGLAAESAEIKTIMIDATYLKARRTATGLRLKNVWRAPGASADRVMV